ncbi:SWA2, partial [Symbiodinium sp. CCMP2456]
LDDLRGRRRIARRARAHVPLGTKAPPRGQEPQPIEEAASHDDDSRLVLQISDVGFGL